MLTRFCKLLITVAKLSGWQW